MSDNKNGFVLPSSGYQAITKILHAYAFSQGKDVTLDDVANKAGLNRTVVSANHGFLSAVGLLSGGKRKQLTDLGSKLSVAISNEIESDIEQTWSEVLEGNQKTKDILHMVKVQKGLAEKDLYARARQSMGLPNDKANNTGINCLIEIMKTSGLLVEKDGKFHYDQKASPSDAGVADIPPRQSPKPSSQPPAATPPPALQPTHQSGLPTMHIDVQIHIAADAKPEQIDQIFASMAKHLYGKG